MKVAGETKHPHFQAKGLLPNKDSGIVKRGHSSFMSSYFMRGKSKVCPRFTKSND